MAQESEKSLVEKRARNAMLARDFALAERLYKSLLDSEPNNRSYMLSLGDVCVQQGDDKNAIVYFQKVVDAEPYNFKALTALGAIYRRLKCYEESVELLHRALDTEINDVQVYYNFGFTYKEMGNYDKAIECFEKVIGANPSDVLALNHLGMIYALRSEHERAVAVYKRALQIDPNHPILQLNMGRSLVELKRYDDAEDAFLAALRARPAWKEVADDYMGLLMKRNKVNSAAVFAKKMMSLCPDDVYLLHNLGNALLKQFDYDGAIKVLKDAKEIDKENARVLSDLAVAYEKNGDTDHAIDNICDAEKIEPSNIDIQKKYAHILMSSNKPDEANSKIQKLYAVKKDDVETLDLQSQYFICKNDEAAASEVMEKINTVAPQYTRHLNEAAERYYGKSVFDKAEKYAREFLESRKENESEAFVLLGKIKEAQGDDENALDFYKRACKSNSNNVLAKESEERLSNAMHYSTENHPKDIELLETNIADEESQDFDLSDEIPIYEKSPESDDIQETHDLFDLGLLGEKLVEQEPDNMPLDFDSVADADEELGRSEASLPHDLNNLMAAEVPYDNDTPVVTKNMAPDFDASNLYGDAGIGNDVYESEPISKTSAASPVSTFEQPYNKQYEDEMRDILRKMRDIADDATDAARAAEQSAKAAEYAIEQMKKERETVSTSGNDDAKIMAEDAAAAAIEKMQAMLDEQKAAADALLAEVEPITDEFSSDSLEVANIEAATLSVGGKDIGELNKKVEELAEAQEKLAQMYSGASAAEKLLPGIIAMLEQGKNMAQFTKLLALFKHIKNMASFLPDEKRHEFMTSRIRLKLEFLIARLSGKPGLISTVNALRRALNEADSDGVETTSTVNAEVMENTSDKKDVVENVVSSLGILATSLDDKELAQALAESADDVLQKL